MSEHFFIRDFRGAFWRQNREGYTFDVADAGVYTEAEATRIVQSCRGRGDTMLPLSAFAKDIETRKAELGKLHDRAVMLASYVSDLRTVEDQRS
jgi:hypothetical protein